MKKLLKFSLLTLVMMLLMFSISAATSTPTATFTLKQGLPEVMQVGDTATVVILVESDQPFISAIALPDLYYPGRGVVAVNSSKEGSNRSGRGTSATLSITFKAKGSTADFEGGVAPVAVAVGARYGNEGTLSERFDFNVRVP